MQSPRPRRARVRPHVHTPGGETEFHLMAADLLRRGVPPGRGFFFHVPNQGKRSRATGGLFKGMGMLPGVADLVLVCVTVTPGGGLHGAVAFLELKHGRGKLNPDQETFRDLCQALGVMWGEARTLEEVEAFARRFYEGFGAKFRATVQ